jgi:hypothetical protein
MAIRLEVEGYCQTCMDFSPDVIHPQRIRTADGDVTFGDTIVQCEHKRRCANIKRYLEQKTREEGC